MTTGYPRRIARSTLGSTRMRHAERGAQVFRSGSDDGSIERQQLSSLQLRWSQALKLPFYEHWMREHSLPQEIRSIADLADWPILRKDDLRANLDLVNSTPNVAGHYRTSGSTSEPFDFPKGNNEFSDNYASIWSYRMQHGLRPFDPFLLTANTISNAGISGNAQLRTRALRALKDIAGNSWKVNGFIPTPAAADGAIRAIQRTRPRYIIGYTSAIAMIGRRAYERGLSFPFLTHAILTSETVDDVDIKEVQDHLSVRVLIEYGAVELGVIAGTTDKSSAWPLSTYWPHVLMMADPEGAALATTLSNRVFPLINYYLGDRLIPGDTTRNGSVLEILSVEGRTKDYVTLYEHGSPIRTVAAREIVYLVRDIPGIESAQLAQAETGVVELLLVAPSVPREQTIARIRSSFERNYPNFVSTTIYVHFVSQHIAGARGKRGPIVDHGCIPQDSVRYPLST
ncbi:hypothetical protein [Dietzia sp. SYD-A1]|uniref:hypothetical protein n=1 Tax=Dietzia sp. SYD-A1 TaxID=2780141 RepID=UPI001891C672|nr:hypothetical protein [Dietzia sp. SYD-A1]